MMDAMTSLHFHGDRPIQTQEQDRFGFTLLAQRIAEALTGQAAGKGFVMGLEGRWGSGKSSLLALTRGQLTAMTESRIAVVEFRPWLIGDRDQLLAGLFEDLVKAIASLEYEGGDATRASVEGARAVASQARRFAAHLGPVGKLANLAGMAIPGVQVVGTVLEGIAAAAKETSEGPTLAEQKSALGDALRKLDCRIVVMIDDVDRLDPAEVAELLRLVRSVADFPNVSYLLCYDATTLAQAVEKATGVASGVAYLEKIIQTEVGVPRPESFALRRWFSAELQVIADCRPDRVQDLVSMIDMTGGRCFDTARSVVRVLDSMRVYWPALEGKVDLVDLTWLRIIAVASPSLYRWIEEYLTAYASLAGGRVMISQEQRSALAAKLDTALAADGLAWEHMQFELDRHLPGINSRGLQQQGKDERLFGNEDRLGRAEDVEQGRLKSPGHSRAFFALMLIADSVTEADMARLRTSASDSSAAVGKVFIEFGAIRGDAGTSKCERLLDRLRGVDKEAIRAWPIETIAIGYVDVADILALDDAGDEWGYPRTWYLAARWLRRLSEALAAAQWNDLIIRIFEHGQAMGFLSHVLRSETFAHGFFGNRPDPEDRITTSAVFETIRNIMLQRYAQEGLEGVLHYPRAVTALYAWSQAGGRAQMVPHILNMTKSDDGFVRFMLAVCGGAHKEKAAYSLSLDAIHTFFDDPPTVVRRIANLADAAPPASDARLVLDAIQRSARFDRGELREALEAWEEQKTSAEPSAPGEEAEQSR